MAKEAVSMTQEDMLTQLEQQGAKGWQPSEGDVVMGVITDIKASLPGEFGIYPIVTVRQDETGELIALHCFHSILRTRLLEKRPVVGERIAVQYQGTVEGKAAKAGKRDPYHNYSVVVDRPTDTPTQAASWDTFTDDDAVNES